MGWLSRPLSLPLLPLCRLDLTKKLVVILPMLRWGRVVVDQLHPQGQVRVLLDDLFQEIHSFQSSLIIVQA